MIAAAPAKLNLCLYVGPTRDDGLHRICSLFAPLGLADDLMVSAADTDEVIVPDGLGAGPDLTARALAALREAGWSGPAVRIEVEKRVPVAAGLGGGSADAAAVLRLAAGDLPGDALRSLAVRLGADVTSQLDPRFCLVEGAGEDVSALPTPTSFGAVLVADPAGLSTPAVYAEADRLGLTRTADELEGIRGDLIAATVRGAHPLDYAELLVNDLAEAATSLRPAIAGTLAELERGGADLALVTGSGPTAVGICRDLAAAESTAERLDLDPGLRSIVCEGGTV